jgi:hypothetical protein
MLQASQDLLTLLYDGRPKILVVKPRALSWTFIPPTDAICWLVAETSNGTDFILGGADGGTAEIDWHPIELPPANVWAVWSPEGAVSVAGLADWWSRVGGVGAEPIFVHGDAAMLSVALIERSLAEVDRLTRTNQLLIEDLATLRESWAHDVRLPPELAELLANLRVAPPRLVFETPAANGDTGVPAGPADGTSTSGLRQRLPMGARGLLGIDLHVTTPGTGDGVLEVALVALESEAELARWRMPYGELDAGWLPLRLPTASTLNWRALELRVHAAGGATAPRLSCAPTGLLGEYASAAPAGDTPSGTMLAFKLWGGIPGIGTVAGSEMAPLPANPVVAIPEHVIAAARSTRDLTWAYPYFGYIDRGRVLLRPLRVTPASAACIGLPAVPGLAAVSCEAKIDDGLCKTRLLVRLVATRPGHGADDAEQGVGVLASTGWIELAEPLKPFALAARLPEPESGPVDVHFFSRLPQGGTLAHGRVIFSRFEAELYERAIWKRGPVLPEM